MQPPAGEGRVIAGRYRLGRILGRGGMAEVYDAFDERLDRPVAVKLLLRERAADPGMRERFEREARSAARLNHPSVVAVYDSGEDDGDAFLVMPRLPGETLADRMRSGPVAAGWLAAVAGDVLDALDAAHRQGIVHRDVKPANILLDADGSAKVTDFGIAKAFRQDDGSPVGDPTAPFSRDLTETGMVLGTVAYLSPELIEGGPATPQADLYALGVVLYEALAGHKPYVGDTPVAQARAAVDGGAPDIAALRPDTPPGLAAVIRRSMVRDPQSRYPSAAAMRADLDRWGAAAADPTASAGAGPTDPTVLSAEANATRVLPVVGAGAGGAGAGAGGAGAAGVTPTGASGGRRRSRRLPILVALLAAAVIAATVAVVLLAQQGPTAAPHATAPKVTPVAKATTTTTTDPQKQELLSEASSFDAIGTAGAREVAQLLRHVADTPAAERPEAATAAAATAYQLLRAGSITPRQYDEALADLQGVGATAPATTTTSGSTTTTTSTTTTSTTTTTTSTTTTVPVPTSVTPSTSTDTNGG